MKSFTTTISLTKLFGYSLPSGKKRSITLMIDGSYNSSNAKIVVIANARLKEAISSN